MAQHDFLTLIHPVASIEKLLNISLHIIKVIGWSEVNLLLLYFNRSYKVTNFYTVNSILESILKSFLTLR